MSRSFEESDSIHLLLSQAAAGNASALDRLYEQYAPRLLDRIRLMMGGPARRIAESGDFLQGVFAEILADTAALRPRDEAGFLRWATSVARNNIRDGVRRKRERALADLSMTHLPRPGGEPGEQPGERAEARDEAFRLAEALEKLTADERTVIELRDLEGLSYREIAGRMERSSEAAVQMLHARALARLTALLAR